MSKYFGILIHLLEPLGFRLRFFIIKICFTFKVNTICGAGRDTRSLCQKFNSQDPTLRILGLRVASPKFQGPNSRVPCPRILCPRVPEFQDLGPRAPDPGSQVSESQVSGVDFRLCCYDNICIY